MGSESSVYSFYQSGSKPGGQSYDKTSPKRGRQGIQYPMGRQAGSNPGDQSNQANKSEEVDQQEEQFNTVRHEMREMTVQVSLLTDKLQVFSSNSRFPGFRSRFSTPTPVQVPWIPLQVFSSNSSPCSLEPCPGSHLQLKSRFPGFRSRFSDPTPVT